MSFGTASGMKLSEYRLRKHDGLPKNMQLLDWHRMLETSMPVTKVAGFVQWIEDEVRLLVWLGQEGVAVAVHLDRVDQLSGLSERDAAFINQHIGAMRQSHKPIEPVF